MYLRLFLSFRILCTSSSDGRGYCTFEVVVVVSCFVSFSLGASADLVVSVFVSLFVSVVFAGSVFFSSLAGSVLVVSVLVDSDLVVSALAGSGLGSASLCSVSGLASSCLGSSGAFGSSG